MPLSYYIFYFDSFYINKIPMKHTARSKIKFLVYFISRNLQRLNSWFALIISKLLFLAKRNLLCILNFSSEWFYSSVYNSRNVKISNLVKLEAVEPKMSHYITPSISAPCALESCVDVNIKSVNWANILETGLCFLMKTHVASQTKN